MSWLSFAAVCASAGASIAVGLVCLCGGYIAAIAVLERFGKTVLGTHVRHFFTRIAPPKRFDENDQTYILNVLRRAVADGRISINDRISA